MAVGANVPVMGMRLATVELPFVPQPEPITPLGLR
jgi:hypothetical protein